MNPPTNTYEIDAPHFLSGGGEMGKLIRSKDWSKTPLGSPDTWPQSLRTTVSLCLASNFPIAIAWGPHRVQIYNDGYWPITGNMHPSSMGQDFKECWFSAWPVIGQAFEEASVGQTRFLENQRIFLDRYNYIEETFFTFSFSPIHDESGGVGGLFHPVIELTQQTLAERRLNILRAVADNTVNARTEGETSSLILECLKDFELDLPFVLLYSIAANGKEANLEGCVGIEKDSPLATAKINLEDHSLKSWPFTEAIQKGAAVQVEDLAKIFGTFTCGPYPEPVKQALIFPVTLHGTGPGNYLLVTGVSSRRSLDEKYLLFYNLLTSSVSNALTKARANDEERKKAEALAEIDKAKTVFFSNISHEFRTPLTLILGSLEELLNKRAGEIAVSDKEAIDISHRNAMRLLRLVNNLLDFSRIEAGKVQAQYQPIDIAKYTTELASNFRSVIENAGLLFQVKTDGIMPPVYVDKEMWEKIVLNLLSNAFKYTLKGSITVTLDTAPLYTTDSNVRFPPVSGEGGRMPDEAGEGLMVRLKVEDTGVGIPGAELPKIFQRFHRVQNVVGRTYEGTGIGLSLVSELVKLHGGEISVQSKEAEGSVFTVSIPTGNLHLPSEHIFEEVVDPMDAGSATSSVDVFIEEARTLIDNTLLTGNGTVQLEEYADAATVLVVDDNADMRAYIKNLLKKRYRVVTANNGMDALHKLKEYTPQLIVSDIMMPVMDGIQLLKAVKEAVQTQHIPVILLSARAGEESKIEGYETGADDYLVKPFSAKELLARVASQLKLLKLRQATDTNVRNLFMQAPASICVLRGPQHIYQLANSMYLQLIGRSDIIGKSVREALPELEGSGIYELLDEVYKTGEPFIAREMPVSIQKDNGTLKEIILNFIYQPSRNEDKEVDGILVYAVDITDQIIARKKIEKSEEHLQDIFYQAPAAIAVLEGESHKYVLANSLYQKMINRSEEQLLGKTVKEVFPELGASGVFQIFDAVFKTGEPFVAPEFEAMMDRFNDGVPHTTYYNFTLKPLKTGDKVTSLMVVAYDITEQVEARKKVEDSEKRYHHLIQSSPSAIGILKGEDLVVTIANDAIIQIWGKGKDVFGKKYFEVMPELVGQGYKEVFETVYTTGVPFNAIETPLTILQDGEMRLRYYNFYLFPQKDLNGSIDGVGIIANEVTSQALTNNQVKESENRFQNLVREATVGIVVLTGEEMKVEIVNEAYAKLVGLGPDELLGKALFDKIPDAKEYYLPLLEKVRQTGEPLYLNDSPYSVVTKGKKIEGFLHVVYQPYRDIAGNILGVMVIIQDVTESVLSKQKLQENEERFRTLSNSIPQLAWMTDAKGWIYWYNQRWYDYTGTTLEQMQGWGWQSVHHPDLVEGIKRDFADAIAKGEPYDDTFLLRSKGGEYRWFLTRAVPIRNAVGEIVQWFGTNTDVSAQREIEEALKVAKEQLELTFKNVPSAIYHFDKTGNILYLNDKGAHQMGYATVEDVMAEKDIFRFRKRLDETFAILDEKGNPLPAGQSSVVLTFKTGRPSEVVSQFIHRETGSAFWLLSSSAPLYNEKGELTIVLTTSTDITIQKTSEQAIRQSEEKFRTLAETLPQLIWMTDEKGVQEYASSKWKEYAGFEPQGLETWEQMVHPDDLLLISQTWMNSIQNGGLYKAEVRLKNKEGEYRWHFVQGEPIRNDEEKIIKWIGAFTDIHDQKTVEEKLEKIVAKRTKELERSNEDLQQFAHVASHDLKEPIRKIKTFGGRLSQEFGSDLPDKAKTYVAKMESAANRVYAMIDGVLMYSSLDADVVPAEKIALDETIRDIESDLELLIVQKNATLQYQDLPSIEGSSILIYQLFYNLINNALKFSKNEVPTTIGIAAGRVQAADLRKYGLGGTEENYVRILIKDNGIGFSFLEAEKIFKTFARLHSKDQYEGSGLGLALCKKIVGRHGGAISATGEENQGATFEVILPLKPRKITDAPYR